MPQLLARSSSSVAEKPDKPDKPEPKKKFRPGKRGRTPPNVPAELKDAYQQTAKGKPICWANN